MVGGFNPSEKYESVGVLTFPTEWKNKKMFQTNNQLWSGKWTTNYYTSMIFAETFLYFPDVSETSSQSSEINLDWVFLCSFTISHGFTMVYTKWGPLDS